MQIPSASELEQDLRDGKLHSQEDVFGKETIH
jgi:hypothetical protein